MALVSHRFHDIVLRILHNRLLHAASLRDHKLVLECFHPSSKLSAPHLFCEYLGTNGLSNEIEGEGSLYEDVEECGRLGKLSGLYSKFRPIIPELEKKVRRLHPAGGAFPGPSTEQIESKYNLPGDTVNLESHELFSQLVTITNLVKVGPKRGLFLSCVNISDGVIRIWRDWLADRAKNSAASKHVPSSVLEGESSTNPPDIEESEDELEARTLWVDNKKTVGLRLRVSEQEDVTNRPLLLRVDEDAPVSYTLHYEGKSIANSLFLKITKKVPPELIIRTTQLLLQVEESLLQERNHSGKAIVIGNCN